MMLPHHRLCVAALSIRAGQTLVCPTPSDRILTVLAGADADRFFDREDEYLSVAEFARAGGLDNRVDSVLDDLFVEDDFNLQFRHEFNLVFAAPVDLGVALLPSEAFYLADGHALHAERLQRVFDAFKQVRTNDRFNLFHSVPLFLRKSDVCLRGRLSGGRREGRLLVTRVREATGDGVQAEIVAFLAMLRQVESGHLILTADADADDQVDDFENDE